MKSELERVGVWRGASLRDPAKIRELYEPDWKA